MPSLTRRVFARVASTGVVASALGCTLVASFDPPSDASCTDASCGRDESGVDGAVRLAEGGEFLFDGGAFDADDAGAGEDAANDAGECSVLAEGQPCAKATTCSATWTCHAAICTPDPLPEVDGGIVCGEAPDICHERRVCAAGLCGKPPSAPDGTACGSATDVCHEAPTCSGGICGVSTDAPLGTPCGAAPDVCHEAPTCSNGVCAAPPNAPDGTTCGKAPDDCHDSPVCSSGKCKTAVAKKDGTPWGSGGVDRCCSGRPVATNSDSNCGVCGWRCESGTSCKELDGHFLCEGCTADSQCPSGCCSTSPSPSHCSPSNCAGACRSPTACTDGSHCETGTVDFCTY